MHDLYYENIPIKLQGPHAASLKRAVRRAKVKRFKWIAAGIVIGVAIGLAISYGSMG